MAPLYSDAKIQLLKSFSLRLISSKYIVHYHKWHTAISQADYIPLPFAPIGLYK